MFNFPLFKQGIKSNYKLLIIFMLVLCMYISVIVSMFDPVLGAALDEFSKTMPELMAMFGMSASGATMISFLSTYLYGFIMLLFPMLFTIIITNRLVTRFVDKGSMSYLLAAPHSRVKVVLTQLSVFWVLLFLLLVFSTILGIVTSEILFPNELDIAAFIMLNIGVLCLHFAIGGFCFFTSCISNETRTNFFIGAGFLIVEYLIQMLANMGGKLENLKYFTFFKLFDPSKIIASEQSAYTMLVVLTLAGIILYITATYTFHKRDLPI